MKYERLTKKGGLNFADENLSLADEWGYSHIYKRLAELEDKIEQGTLIELPCKVGDTIWGIYEFADEEDDWYEIYPVRVREIHIRKDDIWLEIKRPFIGKFVSEKIFFAREEAEKRLKELLNG